MRKKTFQCLGSFVRTSLLLAVGAMTAQQVVAAERVNVRGVDHAALRSASSAVNGGGASVPSLQQMLALDPRNNFQVLRKNSDPSGKTHTRYEQKFHGIPVYGEQVIVQGSGFNWIDQQHFRIVILPRKDDLQYAIEQFSDFIQNYKQ